MDNIVRKTFEDLKSLKIQGATNVRKAIVDALEDCAKLSKAKTSHEFREKLEKAAVKLLNARPTEPDARNAVFEILNSCKKNLGILELKHCVAKACIGYELEQELGLKKIAEFGKKIIPKNAVVLTHCHSKSVERILFNSKNKIEKIYCTETRPKLQGRITATGLAGKGFDVTLIVDSASATFLPKCDLFISGADAITAKGDVINKIGTKLISGFAKQNKIPHYVVTASGRFDPLTCFGIEEIIEQRNPAEVWDLPPKNLKIKNPAFDLTEAEFVKAIVSEKGILSPENFAQKMRKEMEAGKRKKEYLEFAKKLKMQK